MGEDAPGIGRYEREEATAVWLAENAIPVRIPGLAWEDMLGGQYGQDAADCERRGVSPDTKPEPDVVRAILAATTTRAGRGYFATVMVETAEVADSLYVLADALTYGARDSEEPALAAALAKAADRLATAKRELDARELDEVE